DLVAVAFFPRGFQFLLNARGENGRQAQFIGVRTVDQFFAGQLKLGDLSALKLFRKDFAVWTNNSQRRRRVTRSDVPLDARAGAVKGGEMVFVVARLGERR